MKRYLSTFVIGLLISVFLVQTADAQLRRRKPIRRHSVKKRIETPAAIGIQGGNDFKNDDLFAGAHLWLPMGIFWRFVPSGDYFFVNDDTTKLQLNGDFIFKPSLAAGLYLGAGIASQYVKTEMNESQWDFGWNLLVGFDFSGLRLRPMYPYIQARWTIIDKQSDFSVLAGLNFALR